MNDRLRFTPPPGLKSPALVVGWSTDVSRLGTKVGERLTDKLGCEAFGEIESVGFFPLNGVAIENDLVQFPESRFYACPKGNLVVFRSPPPSHDWYRFLSLVLDAAQSCGARVVCAVGGMLSLGAHTAPRQLVPIFHSPELKRDLDKYGLGPGIDYETPAGQRPSLNAFLLWAAQRRNIPAVTFWVPIPFYLLTVGDPKAEKTLLEFLDRWLNLGLDLSDLDAEVQRQSELLAEARNTMPDVHEAIKRLENKLQLSEEENLKLAKEIEDFVGERSG